MNPAVLTGDQVNYLEELYAQYQKGDASPDWADFFSSLGTGGAEATALFPEKSEILDMAVQNLMNTYRKHGHRAASLDPLKLRQSERKLIEEKLHALSDNSLSMEFDTGILGLGRATLGKVIERMEQTYCGSIGAEHFYLVDDDEREFLQQRMEETANSETILEDMRLSIFRILVQAEEFEHFLARKYVGKKRFSLEGTEALIPMMEQIVEDSGERSIDSIVLGMAHRGRLNVLENIMQKPASFIFAEFEEKAQVGFFEDSDVKYHLGYSTVRKTKSGYEVHLSLMFNPSHLEAVNPVVLGSVRARQHRSRDQERKKNIGILIHGDAAFMGQGVVAETLNMMNLEGFDTGGTIHIITNNQIGFTTLPSDSRSTPYSTDLAKGFQVPIFHVNADDPDAVYRVTKLALEYRAKYNKDVVIDLIAYRRLGHNETDEPAFTQPEIYNVIRKHPSVTKIYEKRLLMDGVDSAAIESVKTTALEELNRSFEEARDQDVRIKVDSMRGVWSNFSETLQRDKIITAISKETFRSLGEKITAIPETFNLHPKIARIYEQRSEAYRGDSMLDWASAEALAFASILADGIPVRLSGQDGQRGTFAHRHAVLHDEKTGQTLRPLDNAVAGSATLEIINSPLSEFSVLGFEYGYSLTRPESLIIWEAQFGDFANGAQVIIDQFVSSSEVKWHRLSGLVLLLPHGYEGQGPEHSSARMERYLQLCSKENMIVANPTTPAQIFHLLRRQVLCKARKPLIVFSPKSLLRSPLAVSPVSDFIDGKFQEIIEDSSVAPESVKRVVFVSGKLYYDLVTYRNENGVSDTAIVRLEQLYPFSYDAASAIAFLYPNLQTVVWAQEEPVNMGAWFFLKERLERVFSPKGIRPDVVARKASPSPAAGLNKAHLAEQKDIVNRVFA